MSDQLQPVEAAVVAQPIAFDLKGAVQYSGLSKWRLEELARQERIVVLKEGVKNLFLRDSIDRYIRSLPAR
ncbi:hypothetical protein ACFXG4_04750 [Nocardia sp. NPDC059246]|uniref:hypothetical protein n=1 Tax=unclassified Nocardia TaxID=2637762 RepID=UPI00368CC1B6